MLKKQLPRYRDREEPTGMCTIDFGRALLTLGFAAVLATCVQAQHEDIERPAAWDDLVFGGRFMDRFEPMPLLGPRTDDTWGVEAVKPRDVLNGIEEAEWSYWGGNILQAEDQSTLVRTQQDGEDLIAVFAGKGSGFADHNFTGKLLGRTSKGKLLFGYCRLPWVDYDEPILTVRRPEVASRDSKSVLSIEVSSHGRVPAEPSEIQVESPGVPALTVACPALQPYGKANVEVTLPESFKAGKAYDLTITTGSNLQQPMVFTATKVKIP